MVPNPQSFRGRGQGGLDVGVGISFIVFGIGHLWNQAIEGCFNFPGYGWVVTFVDQNARCAMRNIEIAKATLAIRLGYCCPDLLSYVQEFRSARSFKL
jgi:hypothetical protein